MIPFLDVKSRYHLTSVYWYQLIHLINEPSSISFHFYFRSLSLLHHWMRDAVFPERKRQRPPGSHSMSGLLSFVVTVIRARRPSIFTFDFFSTSSLVDCFLISRPADCCAWLFLNASLFLYLLKWVRNVLQSKSLF